MLATTSATASSEDPPRMRPIHVVQMHPECELVERQTTADAKQKCCQLDQGVVGSIA